MRGRIIWPLQPSRHVQCVMSPFLVPGFMHPDCSIPSFLLPVVILLGSDWGLAVIHGRDRSPQEPHHTEALLVSRLGWGFRLLPTSCSALHGCLTSSEWTSSPMFPPRSPSACCSHLSGIHQGKRIRNTKLVSMFSYGLMVWTSSSIHILMLGYYTWDNGYVYSIINLSLPLFHLYFISILLVMPTSLSFQPSMFLPLSSFTNPNITFSNHLSLSTSVSSAALWKLLAVFGRRPSLCICWTCCSCSLGIFLIFLCVSWVSKLLHQSKVHHHQLSVPCNTLSLWNWMLHFVWMQVFAQSYHSKILVRDFNTIFP